MRKRGWWMVRVLKEPIVNNLKVFFPQLEKKKQKKKQEEFQALHLKIWSKSRLRDYVPNKSLNYPDTQLPGAEYLCNNSKMSYVFTAEIWISLKPRWDLMLFVYSALMQYNCNYWHASAVPSLRRLVAGPSARRPEFTPSPNRVAIVVNKETLTLDFLAALPFLSCQLHSTNAPYSHTRPSHTIHHINKARNINIT